MSEDDRLDIIEGTDEDGNRLLLAVEKYFFYNGEEYVLLRAFEQEEGSARKAGAEADSLTLYVMRVSVSKGEDGEEIEDFEPIDEELAQRLIPVIQARWKTGESGDVPE